MAWETIELPVLYASDPAVQAFIEEEIFDFNPYGPCAARKTAGMLLQLARAKFSDIRCIDFVIWLH
jgi:hypothetical protein